MDNQRVMNGASSARINRNQGSGTFKAQSLVEFALIVPIFLLLVLGTFDLGRLFYIKIVLTSAAREGAYYLSYTPADATNCTGGVCYLGTIQAVQGEANNMGVQVLPANVTVSGTPSSGNRITVAVRQQVNLFIFNFISGPVQLSGTVRMLVQ